jgi:hypothetical protein
VIENTLRSQKEVRGRFMVLRSFIRLIRLNQYILIWLNYSCDKTKTFCLLICAEQMFLTLFNRVVDFTAKIRRKDGDGKR